MLSPVLQTGPKYNAFAVGWSPQEVTDPALSKMAAAMKGVDMESTIALALSDFSKDEVPKFGHGRLLRRLSPTPRTITRVYSHFAHLSERRPDTFIRTHYPHYLSLLLASRKALAALVNYPASSLVYVPKATTGVRCKHRSARAPIPARRANPLHLWGSSLGSDEELYSR
ncbi:hypothetical protein FN846DRAFT_342433 [Sphaerosporella brunnea]|uniref:Uncharacterized protein n=1 Tax=Sphaerosporella brunnea TaxID=1250544 RepID=A0A5J5EKX8_9PEZI|nr:hypothetical protein FN846DRAFT_342433 [Sphaerosporella brunnea]